MPSILSFRYSNDDPKSILSPVAFSSEVETLDQVTAILPEGAYTTFRTYPGQTALHLSEHFQRLEESSRLAGFPIKLDVDRLRANIRQALAQFTAEIARVRVMIPFTEQGQVVYLFIGALTVPSDNQRKRGVKVVTREFHRSLPEAKLTGFISSTQAIRKILGKGIEEVIMVDDQKHMLEGLTSNFFAVIDGIIYTAGEGVLYGITRRIVLEIAQNEGMVLKMIPPSFMDLDRFSEAFITSTSRAVLPVTVVDSRVVGTGEPGDYTKVLMQQYDRWVEAEVKPI